MDSRDEELLREIELLGGRRVAPEKARRILGYNKKTFYLHLEFLEDLGRLSRTRGRRGTDLDLIVDGESSEARAQRIADSHLREIEDRAKAKGGWTPRDLGEWFDWGAYASGPIRGGRRGHPRSPVLLVTGPAAAVLRRDVTELERPLRRLYGIAGAEVARAAHRILVDAIAREEFGENR